MAQSFQAPERIGAKELAEQQGEYVFYSGHDDLKLEPKPKGTTDHDGDGKMGGVKGKKPKAKK